VEIRLQDGTVVRQRVLAAEAGYITTEQFTSRLSVFQDFQIYPAFTDFSDVFLTTQAGLRASIIAAMFAELKAVVDYDSTPALGLPEYSWNEGWRAKICVLMSCGPM
jgi:Protein of unknown function, DUF481